MSDLAQLPSECSLMTQIAYILSSQVSKVGEAESSL